MTAKRLSGVLLLLAAMVCNGVLAAQPDRPRIGLVLGGGGARGLSHIGVLKIMEEARVPVDCIVGTSMGALVSGSFAVGRTPADLESRIVKAPWDQLLKGGADRGSSSYQSKRQSDLNLALELGFNDLEVQLPESAISTQRIEFFLREMTYAATVSSFDELATPYRAVATDLVTGDMIVLKDGDLVTAMLGSMAVPGVFPPVDNRGHLLADGGLVRNVPVDIARELCADVVIAVNVGTPPLKRSQLKNVLNIADQYTRLMMNQNVLPQLASLTSKDVLIEPELGELTSSDFDKSVEFIKLGEEAARKALPSLQRYSLSPQQYAAWLDSRAQRLPKAQTLESVEIGTQKWVNPEVVQNMVEVSAGEVLDQNALDESLHKLQGTGDFSQVNYQLLQGKHGQRLVVHPVEKVWGPNYLGLGLNYGTDFDGWSSFDLTAQYRRTWMNSLGGEWRVLGQFGSNFNAYTEVFQPLFVDRSLFVAPYMGYSKEGEDLWIGNNNIASYDNQTTQFGVDVGTILSTYGAEFRIGPVYHDYKSKVTIGIPAIADHSSKDYGVQLQVYYDQLDDVSFPRSGAMVHLLGYQALGGTDGYDDYNRLRFTGRWAFDTGKLAGNLKVAGQLGQGDQPVPELAYLGGFMNLSSYHHNQLFAEQMAYAGLNLYYPIDIGYLGLMLEGGIAQGWPGSSRFYSDDVHYSGMLYWGMKSILGPFYLGMSYGDNKSGKFYLILGQPN
ncbi:patatin-like phospholipase family protein [Chitinilyticum aquatile]|uniref:patatin-like phospholipase family protein n=1 Tax=Chitinilyticum aquatile TaxID=362520 RepID=UPI0003F5CD7E|nr:patatin-like phospholipase family protein [Chitinilyticum aquatile]